MTYAQFLFIFIIPPLLLEIFYFRRSNDSRKPIFTKGILLLSVVAFVYTTPWDNYLVMTGVWSYSPERILGTIGYVPIEEYCFFILQTCLTGLWCFFMSRKIAPVTEPSKNQGMFFAGLAVLVAILLLGVFSYAQEKSRYLALILVWATPIVILQWCVGGRYLLSNWKWYFATLAPPTIYLWLADALAIHLEVWKISMTQTVGIKFGPLPLEEAVFFLVTNVLVGQGLILFVAMRDKFPAIYLRLNLKEAR